MKRVVQLFDVNGFPIKKLKFAQRLSDEEMIKYAENKVNYYYNKGHQFGVGAAKECKVLKEGEKLRYLPVRNGHKFKIKKEYMPI